MSLLRITRPNNRVNIYAKTLVATQYVTADVLNAAILNTINIHVNNQLDAPVIVSDTSIDANNVNINGTLDVSGLATAGQINTTGIEVSNQLNTVNASVSNQLTTTKRILTWGMANANIYANSSWARQILINQTTGISLTPAPGNPALEPKITPSGSNLLGTLTWPANTVLRGDIFKYTASGVFTKASGNTDVSFKFYILNTVSNVYTLVATVIDTLHSTATLNYRFETEMQLRTDPGTNAFFCFGGVSHTGDPADPSTKLLNNNSALINTTVATSFLVTCVFNTSNATNTVACNITSFSTM